MLPIPPDLAVTDVFTPGAFPEFTYVERKDAGLEQHLRDALETRGQIISLVGPSKSGKTVLVEKVVGVENLLVVTGAGIAAPSDVWDRFLDAAHRPISITSDRTQKTAESAEISAEGSASVWALMSAKLGFKGRLEAGRERSEGTTFGRRGLEDLIEHFANTSVTFLIDDFHYMAREVQLAVTEALKEAARRGLRIIVAAVAHRADDIGRANPDLRGRVELIEFDYWPPTELEKIAMLGFEALNADIAPNMLGLCVRESAGSPQLMQLICLNTCREVGLRQRARRRISVELNSERVREVFRRSARTGDYRSLVEVMEDGPRVRGTERKLYQAVDGWRGDVYSVVLSALALDPPRLSLTYDELVARARAICDGDAPSGSSITVCCAQMHQLAERRFPTERVIDWDDQKQILSIPDPHFLFYLRWSGKLQMVPDDDE